MEQKKLVTGMKVHALDSYEIEFTNILSVKGGDKLQFIKYSDDEPGWVYCAGPNDQEGWMPLSSIIQGNNDNIAKNAYTSQELKVEKEEVLTIERIEYNWVWVKNTNNDYGWVPKKILK